jgi:hypothetical protein
MQLALLSAVTYWIANRVASRLQALMGKVCCYVSAWRCGHLRAACNGLRMWCFRLCCRLCFATPSRHAHLAASRHLPPPNYYQRRRRARTAPQASPARTPAIMRSNPRELPPLGLVSLSYFRDTIWRPTSNFSHFPKPVCCPRSRLQLHIAPSLVWQNQAEPCPFDSLVLPPGALRLLKGAPCRDGEGSEHESSWRRRWLGRCPKDRRQQRAGRPPAPRCHQQQRARAAGRRGRAARLALPS